VTITVYSAPINLKITPALTSSAKLIPATPITVYTNRIRPGMLNFSSISLGLCGDDRLLRKRRRAQVLLTGLVMLGLLGVVAHGENFTLNNGETVTGEVLASAP